MIRLRDDAAFHSVGNKKIILLDECHDISRAGQDALLKQTEDCPDHLLYIFCTTDPDKVNKTLRDRCMEFQITKVNPDLIVKLLKDICLKENFTFEEDALFVIAEQSAGHIRNALNILKSATFLGPINIINVNSVSSNYDTEIYGILSNLGTNLNEVLDFYKRIASLISARELYNAILSMLNDTSKLLFNYEENFSAHRKKLITQLKDILGFSALEFLNYLIQRDKFIDKIGIQSDLVLLHYKFCSNSFRPQIPEQKIQTVPEKPCTIPEINNSSQTLPILSHAQLSKLNIKDKSRVLREQRKVQKNVLENDQGEKVPAEWSLPKEERQGSNSLDDEELDPLEFSRLLVGGRLGDKL